MYRFDQVVDLVGATDIRIGDKVTYLEPYESPITQTPMTEEVVGRVVGIQIPSHQQFQLLISRKPNWTHEGFDDRLSKTFSYGGGRDDKKTTIHVERDYPSEAEAIYIILAPSADPTTYGLVEIEDFYGASMKVGEWEDYPNRGSGSGEWKRIRITAVDIDRALATR